MREGVYEPYGKLQHMTNATRSDPISNKYFEWIELVDLELTRFRGRFWT